MAKLVWGMGGHGHALKSWEDCGVRIFNLQAGSPELELIDCPTSRLIQNHVTVAEPPTHSKDDILK